jgi:hypothetical protein
VQTTRRMPRCHSLVPVHAFRSSLYLEYQSGFLSMEACSTAVEGLVCPVKSPFYLMFCYIRKGECVVCMKRRPRFEISTRMSSFAKTLFRTTIFRGGAYELPTIIYIIYNIGRTTNGYGCSHRHSVNILSAGFTYIQKNPRPCNELSFGDRGRTLSANATRKKLSVEKNTEKAPPCLLGEL